MLGKFNILVCTDFSSFSDLALMAAENLRARTNGTLQVLHVAEHQVIWDWLPGESNPELMDMKFEKEILYQVKKKLDTQMRACEVHGERHLSSGLPAPTIVQTIVEKKIDIVVMGHKGKIGSTFRIGSLAEKIVASSPVPVLIVKTPFEVRNIGALVDPYAPMQEILSVAEKLSALYSSRLSVVSLFPNITARYSGLSKREALSLSKEQTEEFISETKAEIKKHLHPESHVHLVVDISTERKLAYHLNSIIEKEKIDLPIMKRHQSDYLEKIFIGSETRRMLEVCEQNLLILPP